MNDRFRSGSRRKFLRDVALAAGGAGLAAAGCSPEELYDNMISPGDDKVDDRFHESMAGYGRKQNFPLAVSNKFSFLWVSDMHVDLDHSTFFPQLGTYAAKSNAVFVLHTGDCVDYGKNEEFNKWVSLIDKHFPVPMFTALGNHDLFRNGWKDFKRLIGPSVMRFRYGPCEFIFIDTAGGTMGRDQMDWLEDTLKNSNKPNIFVLSHYPAYDGSFQTPASMGNTEERMKLFYLLDECNVSYYLCGHKHVGEHYDIRGCRYIIAGAGSTYKPIVQDDPHFYRFDINGSHIGKEKIYF